MRTIASRWGRLDRGLKALLVVLALGLALRICALALYTPADFNYHGGDSARYLRLGFTGVHGLFGDNQMPAGYPAFLDLMRAVSAWLPFTIAVQHLLGLAAAALFFGAVVRTGAPWWAGLVPAAAVALSGDVLFLEHGIFNEALWIPALALAMYLLAGAIQAERPVRWLVGGAVALACASLARNASDVLLPLLAVWVAVALHGSPQVRLRNAAAFLLPGLAVIGLYVVVAKPIAGGQSGLYENQGRALYGRAAEFADCSKFTPPPGTRPLCVNTPPADRPGPNFWVFSPSSPINTKLHIDAFDPNDQELLSSFADAAIAAQPFDYVKAVASDVGRFFVPELGEPREGTEPGPRAMSFANTTPVGQAVSLSDQAEQFSEVYSETGDGVASATARELLGGYQSLFRVDGFLLLVLIGMAAIGWVFGRGAMRAGASLFLISGLVLLVFPIFFAAYDPRYAVPPIALLAAGAGIGLAVLVQRTGIAAGSSMRMLDPENGEEKAGEDRLHPKHQHRARGNDDPQGVAIVE
jgi:hypothetical protein